MFTFSVISKPENEQFDGKSLRSYRSAIAESNSYPLSVKSVRKSSSWNWRNSPRSIVFSQIFNAASGGGTAVDINFAMLSRMLPTTRIARFTCLLFCLDIQHPFDRVRTKTYDSLPHRQHCPLLIG